MPHSKRNTYRAVAKVMAQQLELASKIVANYEKVKGSNYGEGYGDAIRDTLDKLCIMFLADNPRFNRKRFLEACGVECE